MRKIGKNILIIFICIFGILIVIEISLRLFKLAPIHVVNESIYPGVFGDYKPSQVLLSDYVLPYRVKINSLGLRGEEIAAEKPKGVYRILTLGDSYTFGERVDDEQTFPFQLEKLLNNSPQIKSAVEVVNAGHACYSSREEYEYLLERGLRLNPDMVIMAWFCNDITELSREYSWRDLLKEHYRYEPFKSYIRSFAIFNAMRVIISYNFIKLRFGPYVPKEEINMFDKEETATEKKLWDICFDNILKIKNVCKANNIKFILLALPNPQQFTTTNGFNPQLKLRMFTETNGIDFIDLKGKFMAGGVDSYYLLPKDPHFSPAGNKLVAKEIYNFIRERL